MEWWKELPLVLVDGPTSWTDLPTVLKNDILVRLPVKTLVISTAVCKSWHTHIKNPAFISTHIKTTPITQSLLFAPISSTTFTLLTHNHQTKIQLPFTPRSKSLVISGSSCHGIVLLAETSNHSVNRDLHLWNPSLRKHKHLPAGCSALPNISDIPNTYSVVGFGFSKTHNDHRIVRILYSVTTRSFDVKAAPGVEVYSFRKDCWTKVDVGKSVTRIASHVRWVCIDGVIYWLEAREDLWYSWLCWFDLNREVFGEMELPGNFRDGVGRYAQAIICEYKGLLGFCVFDKRRENGLMTMPVSVWVRRGNWVNQLRMVLKDRIGWPLKFAKNGDLILGASHGTLEYTMLVSYDLEKLCYKDIENDGPYSADTLFVESLLLLEEKKPRFRASLLQ